LDTALRILGKRPSAKVARTFGLHEHRARTLGAGVVILSGLQARLGVPLMVSRAGLREGAALALLEDLAAAAA
jgi:exopolyphosphatase/pppGpp-phosphohydrolase